MTTKLKTIRETRSKARSLVIRELNLKDARQRASLKKEWRRVNQRLKPLTDPIRESQRLSTEDFNIRINTRG